MGVIPGPQKPTDADSYAYPLLMELLEFFSGITTFDVEQDEMFALHAYLIVVFGDILAISMIMRMKGHNTIFPSRMCMIKGVCVPDTRNTTHYFPLYHVNHPIVLENEKKTAKFQFMIQQTFPSGHTSNSLSKCAMFSLHLLLLRSSAVWRPAELKENQFYPTSHLFFFPTSFPFNFMHLIWENLIPNLVLFWTGKFKELDEGQESYHLGPGVWEAIGEATKTSGATVPAAYATARTHNIAEDMSACMADSWSFWALCLGPVLLRGRFSKDVYYKHFIVFIKLLRKCLQFEISRDELSEIRDGFQYWVKTFEW